MNAHYVYVDTGYECTERSYFRESDAKKFASRRDKMLDEGTLIQADRIITDQKVVGLILGHFGLELYEEKEDDEDEGKLEVLITGDDQIKFPSRFGGIGNYSLSNPVFKFDNKASIKDIIMKAIELNWCHIWNDGDQFKEAKLISYDVSENIRFSFLRLEAEAG